jgi:hypothetical protein
MGKTNWRRLVVFAILAFVIITVILLVVAFVLGAAYSQLPSAD